MERKLQTGTPSFFRALDKDCTSSLRLPKAFVQEYGALLPENAKLRSSSGETWDVKLKRQSDDDGKCYFTRGWKKFAKDFELKGTEFLVFSLNIDGSMFDVSAFGSNCTERELLGRKKQRD